MSKKVSVYPFPTLPKIKEEIILDKQIIPNYFSVSTPRVIQREKKSINLVDKPKTDTGKGRKTRKNRKTRRIRR
jgi:hypothetical protein